MQQEEFSLENLPQLILTHILSYILSPVDLLRCASVAHRWNLTTKDDSLWKNVYLHKYDIISSEMLDTKTLNDLQLKFTWKNELKNNYTKIPTKLIQVLSDNNDEVWKATWSHNGKYLATATADAVLTIYLLETNEEGKPYLKAYLRSKLDDSIKSVDWSFCDKYVATTTSTSLAYVLSIEEQKIVRKYPCHDFDTYARWLPDESLILGSLPWGTYQDDYHFGHQTLWRKYPFKTEKASSKTYITLANTVHTAFYIPKSNSIAYRTGITPISLFNIVHVSRLSGSPLVPIDEDVIWRDRPHVNNLTLIEDGQILGMKPLEGRWLLTQVRKFVNPPACLVPRVRAYASKESTIDYNQTPQAGFRDCPEPLVPSTFEGAVDYEESLRITTMFQEAVKFDEDGEAEIHETPKLNDSFEIHLWDLKELKLVKTYSAVGYSTIFTAFVIGFDAGKTPDQPYIVTGSEEGIFIFHKAHGPTPIKVLKEHTAIVNMIEMHPKGGLMVSASDDKTVRLWSSEAGVV